MKNNIFKKIVVLSFFILSLSLIGCGKIDKPNKMLNESKVNLSNLLEYKGSYIGDNSAIGTIISNLPANIYSDKFQLKTTSQPYEITINYKKFDDISVRFEDNSLIKSSFTSVMKNNAIIIFSLIPNADIINFNIDSGTIITYKRTDLISDYENDLESITKDTSTLKNFIKTNK